MENTGYIKDLDCTKDTPVIYGHEDAPIYGQGIRIKPRVPGRQDSEHMKKIYLEELLPLEEYDMIAVLLSGGKDSIACYYKLIELGVPKEKNKYEAVKHLIEQGKDATLEDGVVMLRSRATGAALDREYKAMKKDLKAAGYNGSLGIRGVRREAEA